MKTTLEIPEMVAFRPSDGAKTALQEWDKTGYGRSVFINNLLAKYGKQVARELPTLLEQVGMSKRKGKLTPPFTR